MKKEIYKWIIISISFTLTTLFSIIWYASWVNLSTQNTWDVINAEIWNNLIGNVSDLNTRVSWISIPTWFIGSFYLTSCPTWWVLADGTNWTPDLRWSFIRWIWWDINSRDVVRNLWDYQTDAFKSHSHWLSSVRLNASVGVSIWAAVPGWWWWMTDSTWWNETRPKNIALLFCMKQ